jgi:hypothetical protein
MTEWPNRELRAKTERQAVALARAVLDGREPLVRSAQRMVKLLYWLGLRPETDRDAAEFRLIVSETDGLPIGPEREFWDAQALADKDREIARAEAWAREFGLRACERIVQRFGHLTNR